MTDAYLTNIVRSLNGYQEYEEEIEKTIYIGLEKSGLIIAPGYRAEYIMKQLHQRGWLVKGRGSRLRLMVPGIPIMYGQLELW